MVLFKDERRKRVEIVRKKVQAIKDANTQVTAGTEQSVEVEEEESID